MSEIGFCRIKRVCTIIAVMALTGIFILGCSFFDEDINCKAKLILKIINNTASMKEVEFSDYEEESYNTNYETIIIFSDTSAIIPSKDEKNFIINYTFPGNNECFFSKSFIQDFRTDLTVKSADSTTIEFQVFPFDTTKKFQRICTDCVHEYSDTLIIE